MACSMSRCHLGRGGADQPSALFIGHRTWGVDANNDRVDTESPFLALQWPTVNMSVNLETYCLRVTTGVTTPQNEAMHNARH